MFNLIKQKDSYKEYACRYINTSPEIIKTGSGKRK